MRTAGLVCGPAAGLLVFLWNPGGHALEARRLLGIMTLAICFWITEAIPLPATAILASALAITAGVAPARVVLAPYADPVIFLFIGSFLMAEGFRKYGLDRLIANGLLNGRLFGRTAAGVMSGIGLASAAISTCLSNTATAALMTPIAVGAVGQRAGVEKAAGESSPRAKPWATAVLLMVAYGATVGGMATIIGTPPNLLTAGFIERLAGVKVTFTGWLAFGVPIALVLLVASLTLTRLSLGRSPQILPVVAPLEPDHARDPHHRHGLRWTILTFALAGALWTLPAVVALILGPDAPTAKRLSEVLPEAGVALLCASLLFLLPVSWRDRRFVLSWEEGRQVNWGIILLFGGGLSLGTLAETTGLARWAGEGIRHMGLAGTPAGLLAVTVAATIVVSEFASNTAAATLMVPVAIAAAQAAGFDPVRPALAVGLAATCGFIFPVSSPPNAIVFGTGLVPLWRMIRVGLFLDLVAFLVVWLGLLALTPWLPH
ncbi:MAG TPA: SLC13 family permease [Candidatus Polarisedimenticolia bacterium]|nr:SLC13 family permease [Candidatus Polarisedimenticolia bacterium]